MIRLDKYLADMGVGTRTEVKKLIRQGKVTVDGSIEKSPERKIDISHQKVCCMGEAVSYETHEYYMLNKPAGVVSATTDRQDKTVVELISSKKRRDLFPVGRLDKDTEGLLLITNDGELAHRLLSPKKHVDKVYYAKIDGEVTIEDVEAFQQGVDIGEEKLTRPAKLRVLKSGTQSEIELTICEGKFHQVKRMFEAIGCKVEFLKRVSFGEINLDENLNQGEYRELNTAEMEYISKFVGE